MKKLLLIIFFILIFFLLRVDKTQAQVCTGNASVSYERFDCPCAFDPVLGNYCWCRSLGISSLTQACVPVGGGNCGWTAWVNNGCSVWPNQQGCNLGSGAPIGTFCAVAPTPTPGSTPTPGPTPPPDVCSQGTVGWAGNNQCGSQGGFGCGACQRQVGVNRSVFGGSLYCSSVCSGYDVSCPGCAPSCTGVTLNDVTVSVGGPVGVVAATVQGVANGTVQWVDFTPVNAPTGGLTGSISINPARDSTLPSYTTNVTGLAPGTARVTATARVNGTGGAGTCSTTALTRSDVTVTAPGPWWQAVGGAVISGGNIYSTEMPAGEQLVAGNTDSSTAIALYSGNLGLGGGDTVWKVDSPLANQEISYEVFEGKIPSDAVINAASGTMGTGSFSGGSISPDGYKWFTSPGDLTLTNTNINGSAILFVNGNLTITGNVTLASAANDFLLIVVSGDIILSPTVTTLQGIFFADGSFTTGSGAQPLAVTGSVVTLSGVTLSRDLGGGNANPAETFTMNPANYLHFPRSLSPNKIVWREVVP